MKIRLAPSILSANFANLGADIEAVTRGGADQIHVDVMDGHFVPNISIGVPVVKSLRKATALPLDVHLMITDPDRYIEAFVDAGANLLSVHVEVLPHLHRTIAQIKKLGAKAGVVLNPSTPVLATKPLPRCQLLRRPMAASASRPLERSRTRYSLKTCASLK